MEEPSAKVRATQYAGRCRAKTYSPQRLSKWASKGGKAVLRKYGRNYFRQLRKKQIEAQKRSHWGTDVWQEIPRMVACKANGKLGGIARAEKRTKEEIKQWGKAGGVATRNRYGVSHFQKLGQKSAKARAERERQFEQKLKERGLYPFTWA